MYNKICLRKRQHYNRPTRDMNVNYISECCLSFVFPYLFIYVNYYLSSVCFFLLLSTMCLSLYWVRIFLITSSYFLPFIHVLLYPNGCRMLNVLHSRLRHRSSNLNADLLRVNLINDPGCVCGWVIEDDIHVFLECYVEAREQLTNVI